MTTNIIVSPSRVFQLSPVDRGHTNGLWLNSFLGTIKFVDNNFLIEEIDVPLIFILCGIIEMSLLVEQFGFATRIVPIPSTDREIGLSKVDGVLTARIGIRNDISQAEMAIGNVAVQNGFQSMVDLLAQWKPARRDDIHFVRSNWLVSAALEKAAEESR